MFVLQQAASMHRCSPGIRRLRLHPQGAAWFGVARSAAHRVQPEQRSLAMAPRSGIEGFGDPHRPRALRRGVARRINPGWAGGLEIEAVARLHGIQPGPPAASALLRACSARQDRAHPQHRRHGALRRGAACGKKPGPPAVSCRQLAHRNPASCRRASTRPKGPGHAHRAAEALRSTRCRKPQRRIGQGHAAIPSR